MNEPPIVLADEPTGNLDSQTAKNVFQLFCNLNRKLKITFVIITHNELIAKKADRIIEVMDGKIVKDSHLKKKPC